MPYTNIEGDVCHLFFQYLLLAWSQGRYARQCGIHRRSNPYLPFVTISDAIMAAAWNKGWESGEGHIRGLRKRSPNSKASSRAGGSASPSLMSIAPSGTRR